MTTTATSLLEHLKSFLLKSSNDSHRNEDVATNKCGGTICGPDLFCMHSVCLCPVTHLPPSAHGSCPKTEEWGSAAEEKHDGVLQTHQVLGILDASEYHQHAILNGSRGRVHTSGLIPISSPSLALLNPTGSVVPPTGVSNFTHPTDDTQALIRKNTLRVVLPFGVAITAVIALGLLISVLCQSYRKAKIRQSRTLSGRHLLRQMETLENNAMYSPVTLVSRDSSLADDLQGLQVLSATRLRIVHRVGDGAFGTVYKAWLLQDPREIQIEAEDGGAVKGQDYVQGQGQGQGHDQGEDYGEKVLVAVKTLRDSSTSKARREFLSECKIMASLHHPNIITFYGVVLLDDPKAAPQLVTEFAVHGDLATALRRNDPAMRGKQEDFLLIPQDQLLWLCQQVAAGMEYLSTARFIHRDLAARNCLLMEGLHVKISDFGMSKDVYSSESYRVEGSRLLPVRWMSPECLRYGQFTVSSDVWAFGVLLWEVYTYGRQPYCGYSNIQVMQQICQGKLLDRPDSCPDRVHRVMTACWRTNPRERCTFPHICRMLHDMDLQQQPDAAAATGMLDEVPLMVPCDDVHIEEEDGPTITWDDSACDGECTPVSRSCEGLTYV